MAMNGPILSGPEETLSIDSVHTEDGHIATYSILPHHASLFITVPLLLCSRITGLLPRLPVFLDLVILPGLQSPL